MTSRLTAALPVVSGAARLALRWWFGQLAALVPTPIKAWIERRRQWVVADVTKENLIVSRLGGGVEEIFGAWAESDQGPPLSSKEPMPVVPDGITVAIRLSPEAAMRRRITLPLAAEGRLGHVLTHELERRTPFIASQVYFDWRILERNIKDRRINVELAVIPREIIQGALERARRCGLEPSVIGLYQDRLKPPLFNFLPSADEPRRRRGQRTTLALTSLAIFLAIGNVSAWLWRQEIDSRRLEAEIARVKPQAQAVAALQKSIDHLNGRAQFLIQKRQVPRVVSVLRELTQLLPQDTWVFAFQLENSKASIGGYSPSAPDLIGIFSASPMFTHPHFAAPLTQGPKPGLQRFDLAFEVKGLSS